MPIQPPQLEFIPGREVSTFPTPQVGDKILTEYINAQNGSYEPLDYGTPFDSVQHSAFRNSYPDHVLVYQAPADVNGYFYKRIWASNRVDQDTYNYSISYAAGDKDYPTITRTYVVPRDTYQPIDPLTPDEVFTDALLVQQDFINEVQPEELASKYVKVVRVYETLPGPVVTTKDFDTELNAVVTTERQIVLTDSPFTPSSNALILDMKESPRDNTKYSTLRITSRLSELPEPKVEYKTGSYQFPALVYGIDCQVAQLTADPNRSEVFWTPNMRNYPNVQALLKVTTSFHSTSPVSETLFEIPTRNLIYRGISFQIAINNVLNDDITVEASFSGDDRYGDLSEEHTFAATTLTATQYTALIGTYVTIGCDIERWRGQIWVKQKTELLLV